MSSVRIRTSYSGRGQTSRYWKSDYSAHDQSGVWVSWKITWPLLKDIRCAVTRINSSSASMYVYKSSASTTMSRMNSLLSKQASQSMVDWWSIRGSPIVIHSYAVDVWINWKLRRHPQTSTWSKLTAFRVRIFVILIAQTQRKRKILEGCCTRSILKVATRNQKKPPAYRSRNAVNPADKFTLLQEFSTQYAERLALWGVSKEGAAENRCQFLM